MQKKTDIEKLNDFWLRVAAFPLISIINNLFFYAEENAQFNISLQKGIIVSLLATVFHWELGRQILMYYRRKYPKINETKERALFTVLGLIVISFIVNGILHVIYNYTLMWNRVDSFSDYIFNVKVGVFFLVVLYFIYEMIYFFRKWQQTFEERETLKEEKLRTQVQQLELEKQLKEVELTNLRQQLNPHFLFNALNSIHALVSLKEDKAEAAVLNLSDLMRYHLNYEKKDFVTVQEEMDTVRNYLELEKIRYDNRLTYDINVDVAVLNQEIPLIMVQTLVENAIKHAVRHNKNGANISVSARQEGGFLKIDVINSGQYTPMNAGSVFASKNSGIGLENTCKRLEMLYGDKALFSIGNRNDSEVVATLSFPMR
jgi:two-component system, LytTR family, sensor kinase